MSGRMPQQLISIQEARRQVLAAVRPLSSENVPVAEALDRVLAQDIKALGAVPPFPSSAMDGYAVTSGPAGMELTVVGESQAGAPSERRLSSGEAIRISTGAAVPAGAEAVIRQEDVEEPAQGRIRTLAETRAGENIRPAGEVMARGARVLGRGTRLGPAALAAVISAGLAEVSVGQRPRVQVISTGDELREAGSALQAGQIHNSNGPMLAGLATHAGAIADGSVVLADDPAATEAGLAKALEEAKVVIVAGGVSVGPHDHVKPALARLGVEQRFWGVALQPGKPTWFGVRGDRLVFGLPGNPVSSAVTFSLFAAPALAALQGAVEPGPTSEAILGAPVSQSPAREQALRVRLERREGKLVAIPNGSQGSHVITSLVGADALALIPTGEGVLESGALVALHPLPR